MLSAVHDGFEPAVDVELREQVLDMVADGGPADAERLGHLRVGEPAGEQAEHLGFARRESIGCTRILGAIRGRQREQAAHPVVLTPPLGHVPEDVRREGGATLRAAQDDDADVEQADLA